AMPHIYLGSSTGSWTFNQSVMPLAQVPVIQNDVNSGNYASLWTDINNDGLIDLMVTHCRQGVTQATDPRRIDQVWMNNGNGTYTQDTTNWTNLRDGAQGWSTGWGDIDNDGDMDAFVLNQDVNGRLLINDGSGVFTDVMSGSGISTTMAYFGENATFHDFDNDGVLDLLLTGGDCQLYKGNGDATFNLVTAPFPYSTYKFRAQGVGDLNGDGFLDVYSSYCSLYNTPSSTRRDKLWMNESYTNGNHWIRFNLTGGASTGMSNKNGIGAIVKIYGDFGQQVREVRSGEGYGIQNSFSVFFGLGSNTGIDSVVVKWPSGIVDVWTNLPADAGHALYENNFTTSAGTFDTNPFKLSVYPNPANDVAFIRVDHFVKYGLTNLSLHIYNLSGQKVYSEAALRNSIIAIERSKLSAGVYLVEIRANGEAIARERMVFTE
ncbi:MAG TPA: FG-GAP-like repeat-containing protein, partial [Bacteroidia bacterium]|nr:FG-GAP-like repeat-containing protein [Bacteroidia bacterium]